MDAIWDFNSSVWSCGANEYLTQVTCRIFAEAPADVVDKADPRKVYDDGEHIDVGYVKAWIIDLNGDISDECEAESQQLGGFAEMLLQTPGSMEDINNHVMYVESLRVEDEFRGHKLGIRALEAMVRRMGYGCTAVFLLPCPMDVQPHDPKFEDAEKGLKEYYSRLGLEQFLDTEYMFFNLQYEGFGIKQLVV